MGAEEDEMEEEAGKRKGGVAMEATAVDDPRSAAKKRWIRRWRISESDDDDDVEEEKQIEISLCRCRCHDRKRGDAQMIEV